MMNNALIVGRIVKIKNKQRTIVTVAVPRTFKNSVGEYETDMIPVILYGSISKTTLEYCDKGDMIGVKGKLQVENGILRLVADKVTFLSTKREKVNE